MGLMRRGGVLRLVLLVVVLAALHRLASAGLGRLDLDALPGPTIPAATVLYALLLSLPAVPAAEIGLALLAMYGAPLALPVWLASVGGLTLAYTVGRLVPPRTTARWLVRLHLPRAAKALLRMEPLAPRERAEMLIEGAPRWVPRWLLRRRYVALALLIALPGNIVLGGGGGLALMAGLSGLYRPAKFVAAAAAATAPIPLTVLMVGL